MAGGGGDLNSFLRSLARDLDHHSGDRAAAALSLRSASDADVRRILGACTTPRFDQTIVTALSRSSWSEIVAGSLRATWAARVSREPEDAFRHADAAVVRLRELIEAEKDANWWLPIADMLFGQYRVAACQADRVAQNKKESKTARLQLVLVQMFPIFLRDSAPLPISKKMGCIFLINHLFKLSFYIRNLRMCATYIKNVLGAQSQCPPISEYPIAQSVCFNYYLGRLKVFEEKYAEAEVALDFAFKRSHASSRGNKRRILEFLIPVKLRLGRFPKRRLLEKYGLLQFATLAGAIQTGDLRVFNEAVREHQEFFVRKGIFLIIDQCKIYVYRNLFRKVHNVHKSLEADAKKANQVPLASFQTALALSGLAGDDAMDIDELECVLANLIFQNFIKGYIAHKQGKLVLSPLTAFPKLVEAASARK